jgi:hypothetical protein
MEGRFSTGTLFFLLSNVSSFNSDPGLSCVNNIQQELIDRLASLRELMGATWSEAIAW